MIRKMNYRAEPHALLLALLCAQAAVAVAQSAKYDQAPLTSGSHYDRNPSVIQHADETWLFFARSEMSCDRLGGCPADNTTYDLFYMKSSNNGKTWGPPALAADDWHAGCNTFQRQARRKLNRDPAAVPPLSVACRYASRPPSTPTLNHI